ncbi:Mechanosensitive channel MscK [termite gut metagenome]|uniref:Mechanosensitive channel MscK n=1 Tax=termite gut metagenome TaxID=433724 RepID=A0A5J4RAE4_9ZZZZ
MRKIKLFSWFLLSLLVSNTTHAQLKQSVLHLLSTDTAAKVQSPAATIDSGKIAEMEKTLEEARTSEMSLRMEMEQLHAKMYASDSLEKARQRERIDSLRKITAKIPVVVEGDTLYYLYAKHGGRSPRDRAKNVSNAVLQLGKTYTLEADSVHCESTDIVTDIVYKGKVIASFTDQDGLWENTTREELAAKNRDIIVEKLQKLHEAYDLFQLGKRVLLLILVIVVQGALFWGTGWVYRHLRGRVEKLKETKLKPISFHDYELFNTERQVGLLVLSCKALRFVLTIIQLFISIPILFSIFPQTEDLAYRIFSYIWTPVKDIFKSIIDYLPDLFTIIVIWLAIKYLVKGIKYLAGEIESEKLKITGFYPDWAQPSFQIIRFLLYAFMIAMIYPLLPKSQDGAFQGISVFVGIIFSLGSSSVIGNVIAGLVITYMRPFKIGDRIKLNDTIGNVIEKTPFVTRIKTPKNEIVTIPNSFIMSSHTVNYSSSARNYGLILHTDVGFSFDVHWKTVHDILIQAALDTPGVVAEPAPFVLEVSFYDSGVNYQINVFIRDADEINRIYSDLHHRIQERANKAGVEMVVPQYVATRDGSEISIPKEYQKKK